MNHHITIIVAERHTGARVDEFLATQFGWLSRMYIKTCIAQGACQVEGVTVHAGHRLGANDAIDFACESDAPTAMKPECVALDIVYEDADLLVVVKPAGMLVHPTQSVRHATLANALSYHLNRHLIEPHEAFIRNENLALTLMTTVRPGLVHRLDRATSGLMVIAKKPSALRALSAQFRRQSVTKHYLALLTGRIENDEQVISAPIGRDPDKHPKWRVMMEDGKDSETHLRVRARGQHATFVEFTPLTGRTNQLRIHASHINHPIIGDAWYGNDESPQTRLCLHAWRLAFRHPTGGAWMEFEAPLPIEMEQVWEQLSDE